VQTDDTTDRGTFKIRVVHTLDDHDTVTLTELVATVIIEDLCVDSNTIVLTGDAYGTQTFTQNLDDPLVLAMPTQEDQASIDNAVEGELSPLCGTISAEMTIEQYGTEISKPSWINYSSSLDTVTFNPTSSATPGVYTVVMTYTLDTYDSVTLRETLTTFNLVNTCLTGNSLILGPSDVVAS